MKTKGSDLEIFCGVSDENKVKKTYSGHVFLTLFDNNFQIKKVKFKSFYPESIGISNFNGEL